MEDKNAALIAQLVRVGFVVGRQPERHRVRVELRDTVTRSLVTAWLPVLVSRASQDMEFDLPDIGDQVLCLFSGLGLEEGWVLGSMYGRQAPPVSSGDKWHRTFSDGTTLEYDRAAHKLKASVQGDIEIEATGNLQAVLQGSGAVKASGTLEATSSQGIALNTLSLSMSGEGGGGTEAVTQGTIRHRGTIIVSGGDVVVNGISFLGHVHECAHDGKTGVPQ